MIIETVTPDVQDRRTDGPHLRCWFAAPIILIIIGAVGMSEIDRLVTGALTPSGRSRSVTDVVGLAFLGGHDTWNVWLQIDDQKSVALWIFLHAAFDVALYVGYVWLLWSFVARSSRAKTALRVLLALEILETIGLAIGSGLLWGGHVWIALSWMLSGIATLKWLVGGFLILAILVDVSLRGALKEAGVRLVKAVKKQRLSFVVVAFFGTLSLVPLPNIWDQLPDVQRSWLDGDREGQVHAVWAAVATAIVSVYLFVLGRQRSERVWTEQVGAGDQQGATLAAETDADPESRTIESASESADRTADRRWKWPWWLFAAVLPWAVAMLAWPLDIAVDRPLVALASGFPAAVLLLSFFVTRPFVVRRFGVGGPPRQETTGRAEDSRFARDVWVVGDVLAASLWVLAGLGLVRSLLAPVALGDKEQDQDFIWSVLIRFPVGSVDWIRFVVLVGGAVVAMVALPLIVLMTRWLEPRDSGGKILAGKLRRFLDPKTPSPPRRFSRIVGGGLFCVTAASLLALMLFPEEIGHEVGVVATTLLALGAWAFILGFLIVRLQRSEPPPIFGAVGLRATPVLTLLLALTLIASAAGGDADLHSVRAMDSAGTAHLSDIKRDTLQVEFKNWLGRSKACDRVIDGKKVRPMVLVAASGGGIRAAVWTAGVMDTLRTGDCARSAVFLSSGVSGGSIGLALSRSTNITAPKIGDAETLAGPSALSAAVAGLFSGDLIAGGTGLRIPSSTGSGFAWRDRAGLMEAHWESKVGSLAEQYDAKVSGPGGVLVMNSAAAGRGCRVFISQVDLATGLDRRADADLANCSGQTSQPAASLDLQDAYGKCLKTMSWATAAMLSARFPTVTPGGRVSCEANRTLKEGRPDLQLIDGGYAEASGLGTLADIAPTLLQIVRNHNAKHVGTSPVVPVVLFLEDAARGDIVNPPQGLSAEILVPLAGLNARSVQTSSGTLLQRLATSIADPCPTADAPGCRDAVTALRAKVPHGIVIAAPLTRPSVEAPLGWTLSKDSITRLKVALKEQAKSSCGPSVPVTPTATPTSGSTTTPTPEPDPGPPVRPGAYVCLNQLLTVLR